MPHETEVTSQGWLWKHREGPRAEETRTARKQLPLDLSTPLNLDFRPTKTLRLLTLGLLGDKYVWRLPSAVKLLKQQQMRDIEAEA